MPYESVDFIVKDTTPAKNPVAGVVVKVLSADGTLSYGMQTTNVDGVAAFLLPSENSSYSARFFKFGFSFKQPQVFSVLPTPLTQGQTNTFDVQGSSITAPVPLDARLCTAFGYFRDVTGAPQANVDIHFVAKFDPVYLDGAAVVKERIIVRTNDKGYVQVNLIRNGQYSAVVQGAEDILRDIDVPDAPNVNMADLLFPVLNRLVTVPSGPIVLNKGDNLDVEIHLYSSDGNDRGLALGEAYIRSSDPNTVSYTMIPTGLNIQAMEVGTAQIQFERVDKSIVRIPDTGIASAPLTVVVQ